MKKDCKYLKYSTWGLKRKKCKKKEEKNSGMMWQE